MVQALYVAPPALTLRQSAAMVRPSRRASGSPSLSGWQGERRGGFLANMFSDSRTTAAVLSAIFAFESFTVQLFVGAKQARIGARQADASLTSANAAMLTAKRGANHDIATMRIKWVEELRGVLSQYHSRLMTHEKFEDADRRLMSELGTKLDLMMNFNEPDQKALWDLADKIYFTDD